MTVSQRSALERALAGFDKWREKKGGRDRIPPELWTCACDAALETSVSRAARELRLNPVQLRAEVEFRARERDKENRKAVSILPQSVTVTKVVAVAPPCDGESRWEVTSPCGWRFAGAGKGAESALMVFMETLASGRGR